MDRRWSGKTMANGGLKCLYIKKEKFSAATLGSRRKVRLSTMICLKRTRSWLPAFP
jgi:hypothetical protein